MSPPLASCQCAVAPDRPCSAPVTEEDLLCDACRAARRGEGIHVSLTVPGPVVFRHGIILSAAPEGS